MNNRAVGIVMSLAAVGLLVAAVLSKGWQVRTAYDVEVKIGLFGVTLCPGDEASCESASYAELEKEAVMKPPDGTSRFSTMCLVTFITSLTTAAFLLLVTILGLVQRRLNWPIQPSSLALLGVIASLIIGIVTLAMSPFEGASAGPGFMLLGGGCVLGLLGGILLGRQRPPDDDGYWDPEPQ